MKKYLLTLLLGLFVLQGRAQTKEEEARIYYQRASDNFDAGLYPEALGNLGKAEGIMGTNPKILYLRVKVTQSGLKSGIFMKQENTYQILMNTLNTLFSKIDKATYPPEKYTEILNIKIDTREVLDQFAAARAATNNHLADLKRREPAFLRDTFDVYLDKMVTTFNAQHVYFDGTDKLFKNAARFAKLNPGAVPFLLKYLPETHKVVLYSYCKGCSPDNSQPKDTLYALCPIKLFYKYDELKEKYPQYPDSIVFDHPLNKKTRGIALKGSLNYDKDASFNLAIRYKLYRELADMMQRTGFDVYFKSKENEAGK